MVPVPTEDFELDPPGGSIWQSLLNLAISVLVVCAAALIGSFLSATSAHARAASVAKDELRIGYQKSASLFVLPKAQGSLEKKLAPLGFGVKRIGFPVGPQLLEGRPDVVELALHRDEFDVEPITPAIVAGHRWVADTFLEPEPTPRVIEMADAVVVARA